MAHHFESLDFPARSRELDAYLADFHPAAAQDLKLHRHAGAEFIYVLEGRLGLYIRDQETMLTGGDSVCFDARQQHGYRRVGRQRCRALVVVAPGTRHAA